MAQYEEQNPLDYRAGGDTVDDFAQKYKKEISRIYQFLNNLREHNSTGPNQVEPQPYMFKVTDNKLFIRNGANNAWLFLFDIIYRMGMSDNPDAVILTSDDVSDAGVALKIVKTDSEGVAHISISGSAAKLNGKAASYYLSEDDLAAVPSGASVTHDTNKVVKTNEYGVLPVDIAGNAAKIAGILSEINNLQDGQVLTYRSASNSWRNEDKGVVGAGKALAIYDGDTLLAEYSGDEPKSIDLATTAINNRIDLVNGIVGRETTVSLGSTAMLPNIPPSYYLECTTPGTTGATAPVITSVTAGDTVTDGTVVWTVRQCLPTSGGVLIGEKPLIKGATLNGYVTISAGSGGGYLVLRGANNPDVPAGAELVVGGTDQILRLINNKLLYGHSTNPANLCDLGGSAIVAKSLGENGYIKYASGLIVQWGGIQVPSAKTNVTIDLPISFTSVFRFVASPYHSGSIDTYPVVINVYKTSSSATIKSSIAISQALEWLAIGY